MILECRFSPSPGPGLEDELAREAADVLKCRGGRPREAGEDATPAPVDTGERSAALAAAVEAPLIVLARVTMVIWQRSQRNRNCLPDATCLFQVFLSRLLNMNSSNLAPSRADIFFGRSESWASVSAERKKYSTRAVCECSSARVTTAGFIFISPSPTGSSLNRAWEAVTLDRSSSMRCLQTKVVLDRQHNYERRSKRIDDVSNTRPRYRHGQRRTVVHGSLSPLHRAPKRMRRSRLKETLYWPRLVSQPPHSDVVNHCCLPVYPSLRAAGRTELREKPTCRQSTRANRTFEKVKEISA